MALAARAKATISRANAGIITALAATVGFPQVLHRRQPGQAESLDQPVGQAIDPDLLRRLRLKGQRVDVFRPAERPRPSDDGLLEVAPDDPSDRPPDDEEQQGQKPVEAGDYCAGEEGSRPSLYLGGHAVDDIAEGEVVHPLRQSSPIELLRIFEMGDAHGTHHRPHRASQDVAVDREAKTRRQGSVEGPDHSGAGEEGTVENQTGEGITVPKCRADHQAGDHHLGRPQRTLDSRNDEDDKRSPDAHLEEDANRSERGSIESATVLHDLVDRARAHASHAPAWVRANKAPPPRPALR